jgi:type IV pilus assembly protein PilY1
MSLLGGGTSLAERSVGSTALLGDILFAAVYTPSTTLCAGQGASRLPGVYYKTGSGNADLAPFGTTLIGGRNVVITSVNLGAGLASSPGLFLGADAGQTALTVLTQTSLGAVIGESANISNKVQSGETDWRETHQNVVP